MHMYIKFENDPLKTVEEVYYTNFIPNSARKLHTQATVQESFPK